MRNAETGVAPRAILWDYGAQDMWYNMSKDLHMQDEKDTPIAMRLLERKSAYRQKRTRDAKNLQLTKVLTAIRCTQAVLG